MGGWGWGGGGRGTRGVRLVYELRSLYIDKILGVV